MLTPKNIKQEFQKYKVKVNSNNNKCREKVNPCFLITKVSLDVSLNTIEKLLNEQGIKSEKIIWSKAALQTKKQDQLESLLKTKTKQKKQSQMGHNNTCVRCKCNHCTDILLKSHILLLYIGIKNLTRNISQYPVVQLQIHV